MRLRAATAAVVVAAFGGTAIAATPVTVDPAAGASDTAFHVQVPALYKVRQIRDRYWFVVHGPGGAACDTSVTDKVGVTPPRSATTVAVDLPGVRVIRDPNDAGLWCPGSFSGHVEFRDWVPKRHRYVVHRIGTFGFQVEAAQ